MQEKKFSLFHLSLLPIRQPSFSTARDLSREDWLRMVLAEPFSFEYRAGDAFYWVPQKPDGPHIIGVIEKRGQRLQHLPPEQGGGEIEKEEWQGAYLILDPASHDDGQKLAVENDIVGAPQTLVAFLLKHINARDDRPFDIEAAQIFDSNNYRSFLKENGNVLKHITFHFVVPNMWNTAGNLDKELKETGDETGTEALNVTFKSRRGIKGDAPRILEGVDYAGRGSGRVRATASNGRKFNSSKSATTTTIEVTTDEAAPGRERNWIGRFAQAILGRGG